VRRASVKRVHDRVRARRRDSDSAAPFRSPAPFAAHPVLRLQQSAGNHAVQRLSAATLQRQPSRETTAATDPAAFIEAQLKLRFAGPDDPGLYVRVQQIQEAISRLTLPEAKRLIERLRGPEAGGELARNFQRLATPSRNRLLAALRRHLPSDVEGKTLGTLYLAGAYAVGFPLVATMEIVPSTEEPGAFAGYLDADAAKEVAVRRATISAIIFDIRLQRYRVFETGVPINRDLPPSNVTTRDISGLDFRLVEFVNLEGPAMSSREDRRKRIEAAEGLRRAYVTKWGTRWAVGGTLPSADDRQREADRKEVQDAYKALAEEAAPFARGQFHSSMELEQRDPSGRLREMTTASPSMINVDAFASGRHGFKRVLDPMAESADVPGAHAITSMPALFEDVPALAYEPYIVLTPGALAEEPLETVSVILHEETHRAHAHSAVALFEQWRASGAMMTFKDWVQEQVKNRRLSPVDAAIAIEQAQRDVYWNYNTELLSEVEGVTSVFHAGPLGKDLGLDRLEQMALMWVGAAPEVQELAVRKLRYYYRRMIGSSYHEAFDLKVTTHLIEADQRGDARKAFYVKLSEFSAAP
jgi:hypothetical protein